MRTKKQIKEVQEALLVAMGRALDQDSFKMAMTWRKALTWVLGNDSIELENVLKQNANPRKE